MKILIQFLNRIKDFHLRRALVQRHFKMFVCFPNSLNQELRSELVLLTAARGVRQTSTSQTWLCPQSSPRYSYHAAFDSQVWAGV